MTESVRPIFFVHVMKTGGTSFRQRILQEFEPDQIFPNPRLDPRERQPNARVSYLAALPPERLERIRAFIGHFPYFATELVPRSPFVLTLLRDPVERAISYLKQHHRDHGLGSERSLDSIYDQPLHRNLHIVDYQVRVFATTVDDGVETVMKRIDIDDRRMAQAKEHLERVEVVGLTEQFDQFVDEATRRLGWAAGSQMTKQRVSDPMPVSDALRRRIAADNEADLEFYEFARQLVVKRRRF